MNAGATGPSSQIPGLSQTADENTPAEKASGRRVGIFESDSDYVKLAKGGGHKGKGFSEHQMCFITSDGSIRFIALCLNNLFLPSESKVYLNCTISSNSGSHHILKINKTSQVICLMFALVSQLFEMQILSKWPPGPQHERGGILLEKGFLCILGKTKQPLLFTETATLLTSAARGKQFKVQC